MFAARYSLADEVDRILPNSLSPLWSFGGRARLDVPVKEVVYPLSVDTVSVSPASPLRCFDLRRLQSACGNKPLYGIPGDLQLSGNLVNGQPLA